MNNLERFLRENRILTRFKNNCTKHAFFKGDPDSNLRYLLDPDKEQSVFAIARAFEWCNTPEGKGCWARISSKYLGS